MKLNYTLKLISVTLLMMLACMTAQAKDRTTAYAAEIHLMDGTVVQSDNFFLPRGYAVLSFFFKATGVTSREIKENGDYEDKSWEADEVDFYICWNKKSPDYKYLFKKITVTENGKSRAWAVLEHTGEKGKIFGVSPLYFIHDDGKIILQGEQNRDPFLCFMFEGDEYPTTLPHNGLTFWTRKVGAKRLFKGDDNMIKEATSGKYKNEDIQFILDNYKRPVPLKIKK